jgi:hypothetical protein
MEKYLVIYLFLYLCAIIFWGIYNYIICSKYLGQVTLKNIFGILPKDHWLKDIDFVNMEIMFNPAINISSIFVMIMFKINKRNFNDYE